MLLSSSTRNLIKIPSFSHVTKVAGISSTPSDIPLSENDRVSDVIHNRNPRNLERLRIAWKPQGYHLESKGREFWHKLQLLRSGRHLTAQVVHHTGPVVLQASTKEWCIRKHLYRCVDRSAYENLARVLVQRCLESGLTEIESGLGSSDPKTKVGRFAEIMEEGGVSLKEPARFLPPRPWDQHRPEKPWEVHE